VVEATTKSAVFAVATTARCVCSALQGLVLELLVFAVPLDGELDQAVEQFRVGDP